MSEVNSLFMIDLIHDLWFFTIHFDIQWKSSIKNFKISNIQSYLVEFISLSLYKLSVDLKKYQNLY